MQLWWRRASPVLPAKPNMSQPSGYTSITCKQVNLEKLQHRTILKNFIITWSWFEQNSLIINHMQLIIYDYIFVICSHHNWELYCIPVHQTKSWSAHLARYDSAGQVKNNYTCRDHFVYVPSQWETALQCNVVSHWMGAYKEWTLYTNRKFYVQNISQEQAMLLYETDSK